MSCPSGQNCYQGQCYCPDGYEGSDCSTASYIKFIGSYNVYESCYNSSNNFFNYSCYVTQGNYINQIYFNGLFNMGVQAGAYIYNTNGSGQGNYIEIPTQSQGAFTFSGTGNFDNLNNRITINFNYTYNGGSYQCTHTFYKQ